MPFYFLLLARESVEDRSEISIKMELIIEKIAKLSAFKCA